MALINEGYSLEEMLRLSELIGCYADGGFHSLMQHSGKKQHKKRM